MDDSYKLRDFVSERNEALFSLDEAKIRRYMKKYLIFIPPNPIIFWGAVYKGILMIVDAPEDLKQTARQWLREHGMNTDPKRGVYGELP